MITVEYYPYLLDDLETLLGIVNSLFRESLLLYKATLEIAGRLSHDQSLNLRHILGLIKRKYKKELAADEPLLRRIENYYRNIE